jgi:hypothetical protein
MVAQLGSEGYFQQYAHHYGYQVPNPPPPPMGPPTSGQSIVSQAYQSLFVNVDGLTPILPNSLLDYPPPHCGAPPKYGGQQSSSAPLIQVFSDR